VVQIFLESTLWVCRQPRAAVVYRAHQLIPQRRLSSALAEGAGARKASKECQVWRTAYGISSSEASVHSLPHVIPTTCPSPT
jgi:hypothetical protein